MSIETAELLRDRYTKHGSSTAAGPTLIGEMEVASVQETAVLEPHDRASLEPGSGEVRSDSASEPGQETEVTTRVERVATETATTSHRTGRGAELSAEERRVALVPEIEAPAIVIDGFELSYGDKRALHGISMEIPAQKITAFIGPSGCGKSTLLRSINRLNDLIPIVTTRGDIRFENESVFDPSVDVNLLRKRVGMVFQKSNPFPKSIYENVAYGCKIQGVTKRSELDQIVERSLTNAALWDEVKDRLGESALGLSGGQQQRLCIARTIATEPEVILFDEPCSALDPIATAKIEELMQDLKDEYTQVIVTHNMQQASRVSDYTAFLYLGELIEYGPTERLFVNPIRQETEDYITGRFG